jgi:hypothetical protein
MYGIAPSGDEFVIHPEEPMCIGKVETDEAGKVRVYMYRKSVPMTTEEEKKMCLEMKNWYYFSKEKK